MKGKNSDSFYSFEWSASTEIQKRLRCGPFRKRIKDRNWHVVLTELCRQENVCDLSCGTYSVTVP
jgi:hypothetical protein